MSWVRAMTAVRLRITLFLVGVLTISLGAVPAKADTLASATDLRPALWPFGPVARSSPPESCRLQWQTVALAEDAAWARTVTAGLKTTAGTQCVGRPVLLRWTDLSPAYRPMGAHAQTEAWVFIGPASVLAAGVPHERAYVLGLSAKPQGVAGVPPDHVSVLPLPAVGYAAGMGVAAWLTGAREAAAGTHAQDRAHVREHDSRHRSSHGRKVVAVTLPLPPDPASQGLLSGLAAGLAREAPGRMAVTVAGEMEPPVVVTAWATLDPHRPDALVTVTGPGPGRLVCGVDRTALDRLWTGRRPKETATAGRDEWWDCALTPPGQGGNSGSRAVPVGGSWRTRTAAVEAALARAASDLADVSRAPGWVADYTRPPIAVPPGEWPRASARPR